MPRRLTVCLFPLLLLAAAALAAEILAAPPSAHRPPAARVVAIGDWHGDLEAARASLRLAGAIDDRDHWIGGDLVVVQCGDQLDRGDRERAILDLLDRLADEAAADGGAVYALIGNHEHMNATGDFRYVADGGWADFADIAADTALAALPPEHRGRASAFAPGGPYALLLAEHDVAVIIGRDLFVHGDILPAHVEYGLDRINAETRAWLRGKAPEPAIFEQRDSPVWARQYSDDPDSVDCALLDQVLAALDCDRIFVGHTIQDGGITPHCDRRVWCLDTGAAAHYGGSVQVLEITPEGVRVLW